MLILIIMIKMIEVSPEKRLAVTFIIFNHHADDEENDADNRMTLFCQHLDQDFDHVNSQLKEVNRHPWVIAGGKGEMDLEDPMMEVCLLADHEEDEKRYKIIIIRWFRLT